MGAPLGHKKYGGRKKGTLNKSALPLHERARTLGVDPFEILLLFCKRDWKALGYDSATEVKVGKGGECYEIERITPEHRLRAASEACQYLHPKRKAVEVLDVKDPNENRPLKGVTNEELDEME